MRTLRAGDSGDDVRAWQERLRALGRDVTVDGLFGPRTLSETQAVQASLDLEPDGIVGPATRAVVASKTGPGPLTEADRRALFGAFAFEPAPSPSNPEGVRITDAWPAHNIVVVEVPQLAGLPGAPARGAVMCHRLAAPKLLELFTAWERAGLSDRVLAWAGMWAPRFVRGSRTVLSNHAWGTAFDINAPWNPMGRPAVPAGTRGSVAELAVIADDLGWCWGARFASRPDPMHFELVRP